jgi:ABC-type branched-subunit amino acid transport system permease subunit
VQLLTRARSSGLRSDSDLLPVELLWLGLLVAYPVLFAGYGLSFGKELLVLSLLALSLDLCWGVAGIISIGHAAFFGAGAYVVGQLSVEAGLASGPLLLVIAIVAVGFFGALIGSFLFTGRRDVGLWYTALATIALTYAAQQFATATESLGADTGIPGISVSLAPVSEIGSVSSYYALLGILASVYVALRLTLGTRLGTVLHAIREDPERLWFLGYHVPAYRVGVFAASAALAGFAGGLWATTRGFVAPDDLGLALSTSALLWVLIGGRGALIGALIGVGIFEVASFELSDRYPTGWEIGLGVAIVAVVTMFPTGVLGLLRTAVRYAKTARFLRRSVA